MENAFRQFLSDHHLRATAARLSIFRALESAAEPLSIVEIIKHTPNVDKVSVYRTIDLLARHGIVTTVNHGWKQRYELADPFRPHHHHTVCTRCRTVSEIHSQQLEEVISAIASRQSFTPSSHTFEIKGICQNCHT